MVVKGGKRNKKETASLRRLGRKKKEKGGKAERKWRYNQSLDGGAEMVVKGRKRNEKERLGKRKKKTSRRDEGIDLGLSLLTTLNYFTPSPLRRAPKGNKRAKY